MAIWVFLTWIFFGTMKLFFENFLIVPKGPLFNFFDILEHNRCLKIPNFSKVPPFRFFGTIFHLTLGFLNTHPPIFFFNTIRNLNVISGVKRYIRIFDVISEVYSVSLRRRRFHYFDSYSYKRPFLFGGFRIKDSDYYSHSFFFLHDRLESDEIFVQIVQLNENLGNALQRLSLSYCKGSPFHFFTI